VGDVHHEMSRVWVCIIVGFVAVCAAAVGKYMSARSKSGGLFRSGVASGAGAGAGAGATATSDAGGKKRKKGEVVGFSPATLASTATLSDQMVMGKRKQRASRTTFNFSGW